MTIITAILCLLAPASAQEPAPAQGPAPAPELSPREFEPLVEEAEGGRVNWSRYELELKSSSNRTVGAWQDRRLQEQDAVENLAMRISTMAEQICVTPELDASDLMNDKDYKRRLVEGLKGWNVDETRYHSAGGVEMTAVLELHQWLRPALMKMSSKQPNPRSSGEGPTGLVIDVRGMEFEPCVAPSVLGADGRLVFHLRLLSESSVSASSPVVYVTDPAAPAAWKRAGNNPIFSQAQSVRRGSVTLPSTSPITSHSLTPVLAAAGRVVIIADP